MNRRFRPGLFLLCCLPAAPLFAQTTIGGGSCTSSTINGTYAVSITGRQVSSAGKFTNVFQSNGSATFDGQSKVSISLTASTLQAAGSSLSWSGTYSVQANCAGVITVSAGGNATFNLTIYNSGGNFLLAGSDATYTYTGSGDNQPSNCSTASLNGVYTLNATGYSISSGAVSAPLTILGLAQFDGQGHVSVFGSISGIPGTPTLTGTYSVASNCTGSASTALLTSTALMNISIFNATSTAATGLYVDLAANGLFVASGQAHADYGQPATVTPSATPGAEVGQ